MGLARLFGKKKRGTSNGAADAAGTDRDVGRFGRRAERPGAEPAPQQNIAPNRSYRVPRSVSPPLTE